MCACTPADAFWMIRERGLPHPWLLPFTLGSIEEVPAHTEMERAWVDGIMRCPEGMPGTLIDVVHSHIKAAMLQVKVCIHIHYRVVAYLHSRVLIVLHGKLAHRSGIVGCVIGGEVAEVAAQLHPQNLGQAEEEIDVGVKGNVWQGKGNLIRGLLISDFAVPMDGSELQVLRQSGAEHLHAAARLPYRYGTAIVSGDDAAHLSAVLQRVLHAEVGVIGHILKAHIDSGSELAQAQASLYAGTQFAVQTVVPPCALRVVVPEVEVGSLVLDVGMHVDGQTVLASHAHSQVDVSIHGKVSAALSHKPNLTVHIIVYELTLRSGYLSTYRDVILHVLALPHGIALSLPIHHTIVAHFMRSEERDTHLCPLVEALSQGHSHRIAHGHGAGFVEHVIPLAIVMIGVVAVGGAVCGIVVTEPAGIKGVYDAGDGNELLGCHKLALPLPHERIHHHLACYAVLAKHLLKAVGQRHEEFALRWRSGFERVGHLYIAVETEVVAMCEVEVLLVIAIPRLAEHDGDILTGVLLLEALRVADIVVILDAAVLTHLHIVDVDIGMYVVTLSTVVSVEGATEHAVGLTVVISAPVKVVQLQSQAGELVDVRGKIGPHTVFSVLVVAALVVGEVGYGTQRIGEAEVLQSRAEEAEGLHEEEIIALLTLHEHTALARRTRIAQDVIVSRIALCIVEVLEVVHHSIIVLGIYHRSQPAIHTPLELSHGYLLRLLSLGGIASPSGTIGLLLFVLHTL